MVSGFAPNWEKANDQFLPRSVRSDESDTDIDEHHSFSRPSPWYRRKMTLSSSKGSRLIQTLGVLAMTAFISSTVTTWWNTSHPADSHTIFRPTGNSLDDINNSTLGFHKVYSMGLPRHWRKRDGQILASAQTGIDIEFVDGVRWQEVPKSEYPLGWHDPYEASIGCWRAHLEIYAKMVQEGIGSALILEDDADWDVFLKHQLLEFAQGAHTLQERGDLGSTPVTSTNTWIYGDAWEFLQVGGCSFEPSELGNNQYYLIENDPTVGPNHRRHASYDGPQSIKEANNTRAIFRHGYGTCTTGYAITLAAARRMLASISLLPNVQESAIDRKHGRMCAHMSGELPLDCLAVYPPLFSMHRFAGSESADSDIVDTTKADKIHEEYSFDLMYSATMNINALEMGATTAKAQFPDYAILGAEVPLNATWSTTTGVQMIRDDLEW